MRTQGEIEAAVCDGKTRFEQEFMGRRPRDIRAILSSFILIGLWVAVGVLGAFKHRVPDRGDN
jgi:hypothetical protein